MAHLSKMTLETTNPQAVVAARFKRIFNEFCDLKRKPTLPYPTANKIAFKNFSATSTSNRGWFEW